MVCSIHATLLRDCGDKLELDIDPETTVFDLKHRLASIWYLPESHQSITLGTKPLSDAVTLATCCNDSDTDLKLMVIESCGVSARRILTQALAEASLQERGYGILSVMQSSRGSISFRVRDTCHSLANKYVAKCISLLDVDQKDRIRLRQEVEALKSFSTHPNLIEYHDSFPDETGDILFAVTSFADSGTLLDVLETVERPLPRAVICSWMAQVLQGLTHVHGQGLVHRNLNPSNLFFHDGMQRVRIGSFGYSSTNQLAAKTLDMDEASRKSAYMSPELMRNEIHSPQTDMWALGCICFQLCTCRLPFAASSLFDLAFKIVEIDPDWSDWNDSLADLRDVTQRLLRKDSSKRPTAAELLMEPLFTNADASASCMPQDV